MNFVRPKFFKDQLEFRLWLEANHDAAPELLVGFYKAASGRPSMTWSESVDQALCFGWIDGVRRRIDDISYSIRFSPRRPRSIWSAINIAKAEKLAENGLMMPAGQAAFERRATERCAIYAYEKRPEKLDPEYEKLFKKHKEAWAYFKLQSPSYKRTMINWVSSAKQPSTRLARLEKLVDASRRGMRL